MKSARRGQIFTTKLWAKIVMATWSIQAFEREKVNGNLND